MNGEVYYNYSMQPYMIDELSGDSVFYRDKDGKIFHTYSAYARGGEIKLTTYMLLDLTPKGRDETGPNFSLADWVRHHDKYDADGYVNETGRYVAETNDTGSCCAEGHHHEH